MVTGETKWHVRLARSQERILQVWEAETRERLSGAVPDSRAILRDALPLFLGRVALALQIHEEEDGTTTKETDVPAEALPALRASGAEHGRQRAEQTEYSLVGVVVEYQILRRVVVQVLEADGGPLPTSIRDCLLDSLDEGIRVAATEFSRLTTDLLSSHIGKLELEKTLREVFVSRLTHDLRTPLSAISMASQILAGQGHAPEAVAGLTSKILGNVRRMDGMITDLLDTTRIRAGESVTLRVAPADLVETVREAIGDTELLHGARCVLVAPESVRGYWAIDALRRVVDNLISNAIKYGRSDGIVTVTITETPSEVTLSVHNVGTPIPDEEHAKIFESFARGSSRNDSAGWGIGLSLVKNVVESHVGRIAVESSASAGTVFTIVLPRDARGLEAVTVRSRE